MVVVDKIWNKLYILATGTILQEYESVLDYFDSLEEAQSNYPKARHIVNYKG